MDQQRPAAVFGPETFGERVGNDALALFAAAVGFAYIETDEPVTHGWMVAGWADGPGNATLVRLMAVEAGGSVLRAANRGRSDMEAARANETMMRALVVFVGRAV